MLVKITTALSFVVIGYLLTAPTHEDLRYDECRARDNWAAGSADYHILAAQLRTLKDCVRHD